MAPNKKENKYIRATKDNLDLYKSYVLLNIEMFCVLCHLDKISAYLKKRGKQ
jgi:hypothetical protein